MSYMIADKKGNIWTTERVDPYKETWALSRYDVESLYDKKPMATEITSGANGLFGILEARDGSIWFGSTDGVYRYDGKTIKKL